MVMAYLQEVKLANGERAVGTPGKASKSKTMEESQKYLDHPEARETSSINAKFVDIVAPHPIQYCFSRLKPRIKVQKFRPVRHRLSYSGSELDHLLK